MDCYIVRIYRRDEPGPGDVIGQVENVERQTLTAFMGPDELLAILRETKRGSGRQRTKKNGSTNKAGRKKQGDMK